MIFLAAGEVSGDVHGAVLARDLITLRPDLGLVGWGSHRMAAAGVAILEDLVPYAAVGLTENFISLKPAARALEAARDYLAEKRPAAVVLIDYQGANMVLARHARKLGIPTVYYISPQEWIWGFRGGPAKVARRVDLILAVFENEAEIYRKAGGQVLFIGHPLLDHAPTSATIEATRARIGLAADKPVLGLFPGSRRAEISRLLPVMLAASRLLRRDHPDLRVVLPIASAHFKAEIDRDAAAHGGEQLVTTIEGEAGINVLAACSAALVASGTVTLEAAVVGTPVVATYRVSGLTAFLARKVFRIGHVSLPNIVMGEEVIPELLQQNATAEEMAKRIGPLLFDSNARQNQIQALGRVRERLGEPGASGRAAVAILDLAKLPIRS